jgi:hypothetical protein
MRIYNIVKYIWDGEQYVKVFEDSYDYSGPLALACGPTAAQSSILQGQQNFATQLQQQASSVYGNASTVFSGLLNTFMPTVEAGPNQQGFSPQELSNLNSEAITQTAQAYQNAKAALGNQISAEGGGNQVLPSGASIGANLGLAEAGANQEAGELANITEQNYAVGRQNYENAVQGLASAPGVFNPATSAAGAAVGAGSAAASTANTIAAQQNSWMQPVIGALSGVAGQFTGGLTNSLFNSSSSGGGGNTPNTGLGQVAGYLGGQIGNNAYSYGGAPPVVNTSGWASTAPSGNSGTGPLSAFGS